MTNFKLFSLCIITALSFTYSSNNYAAGNPASNQPLDFYFGISAGQSELKLEDEKSEVNVAKFKSGVFLQENVALEFSFGQGLSDTSLKNSNDVIDIDSWYSLQVRLQSPQQRGFRIYFQGGYSQIDLSESISVDASSQEDSFSGGTISAGIEQKINNGLPLWVYLDFSKTKDDIEIRFLDFGIRLDI